MHRKSHVTIQLLNFTIPKVLLLLLFLCFMQKKKCLEVSHISFDTTTLQIRLTDAPPTDTHFLYNKLFMLFFTTLISVPSFS